MARTRCDNDAMTAGPDDDRPDDDRYIDLFDDDLEILPDQTRDDTDAGWGEHPAGDDSRLSDERPPHW
jgi:hypothetical protein